MTRLQSEVAQTGTHTGTAPATSGRGRTQRKRELSLFVMLIPLACSGACLLGNEVESPGSGAQPTLPALEQRLASAFAALEKARMPVIVALSHRGGEPVVREFGSAQADGLAPESTLVDLNSITKTVTGVVVAQLVSQGKLSFDDTLGDLFVGVPADKANITVHQLLTHTGGFDESVGDDAEPLEREPFVQRALATELLVEPGSAYRYSNVGYGLLAAASELRSGRSYEDYLRHDLLAGPALEPIGYAAAYDDKRSLRSAAGLTIRDASWGGHPPYWNLIGNGGLVTTPVGLLRFVQALSAGRLLAPELLARVRTPHVLEDEEGTSAYGYGTVVQDVPGLGRVYWHDGGNDHFSAQWAEYVDHGDIIVTAAADSKRGDAFAAMAVLVQHLYGVRARSTD